MELKTYKPVDGAKEYVGLLKAFDKDTITIELKNNTEKVFRRDTVAQIRLTVDF